MKTSSITETKNNLSALLDKVRQGESILILDRNRPIARLEPITKAGNQNVEGRLARLERAGLVRRGKGRLHSEFFTRPLPKTKNGSSVLEVLIEERRENR